MVITITIEDVDYVSAQNERSLTNTKCFASDSSRYITPFSGKNIPSRCNLTHPCEPSVFKYFVNGKEIYYSFEKSCFCH